MKIPFAKLTKILACSESTDWLLSLPPGTTWQQAWDTCPRGDWMLWLIRHTTDAWGTPQHRRLVCVLVEAVTCYSAPFWCEEDYTTLSAVVETMRAYAEGANVSQDTSAWSAAARSASESASESAWADVVRAYYPCPPNL